MGFFDQIPQSLKQLFTKPSSTDALSFNASASAIESLTKPYVAPSVPQGGQVPSVKEYFNNPSAAKVSPFNPGVGSLEILNPLSSQGSFTASARPLTPTGVLTVPQNYITQQQPVQQQVSAPRQPTQTIYNTNPYGMATVGQSGQSGATAQNFSAGVSNGSVGSTGISGGVSNYTGTLGATGASSFPSGVSPLVADEETRKKQENAIAQQKAGLVNQPAAPAMGGFVLSNGDIYNSQTGQLIKAASNYSTIASPTANNFSVGAPTGPINADTIAKNIQDISSQLSTGKINAANAQEFYAKLDEYKNQLVQIEQQKNPITNQPHVVETPEQQAFLQSLNPANRTSVQQQMDSVRQNLGLPTLEADIAKKRTELNAANKVFQEIVKDIRDNPELPAGLKAQRITDFTSRNGILISNLNAELQNLNAQRDSANEQLNQQFQIYKQGVSEQEAQLNRQKEVVNQYIASGAIANFSDASLQQIAAAGLYDYGALKSLRDSVANEKKYSNVQYITGDNGAVTAVGVDKNGSVKVLGSLGAIGKKSEQELSAAGYTPKQTAYINSLNEAVSKNSTYAKTSSMRTYAENVAASLSQGTGVGDIAAINQFQKVIDEGAVTRDQDVKLVQSAQSLVDSLKSKVKKLETGEQLSPELRQQMRQTVEGIYQAQVNALGKDTYIQAKIKEVGLNGVKLGDTILGQLGNFETKQSSQPGQATPADEAYAQQIVNGL